MIRRVRKHTYQSPHQDKIDALVDQFAPGGNYRERGHVRAIQGALFGMGDWLESIQSKAARRRRQARAIMLGSSAVGIVAANTAQVLAIKSEVEDGFSAGNLVTNVTAAGLTAAFIYTGLKNLRNTSENHTTTTNSEPLTPSWKPVAPGYMCPEEQALIARLTTEDLAQMFPEGSRISQTWLTDALDTLQGNELHRSTDND